jgi:hypothetical protein
MFIRLNCSFTYFLYPLQGIFSLSKTDIAYPGLFFLSSEKGLDPVILLPRCFSAETIVDFKQPVNIAEKEILALYRYSFL